MGSRTPGRIRVGIVGASPHGGWGVAAHLPALAHLDEFDVTAVATTRESSARQTADAFEIPHAFANAGELVVLPDVDLVVVSVKAPAHAEVIRAAMVAGKHVFSEWPLGVDLAESTDLAKAAAAAGVVHAIGLQGYQSPPARFVKDLLAEGRIGRVESVGLVAAGDPLGGSQIPQGLAWGTDPATGNTLLTIMVGHALATLDHVVGRLAEVSAVVANLNDQVVVVETGQRIPNGAPSQVALHGRLDGGAVVSVSVHGGNVAAPDEFFLKITGTEGTLSITPSPGSGPYLHWADWTINATTAGGTATNLAVPDRYRVVPAGVPAGPPAHVAALYREIAQAIAEGRQAHPSFHTAARLHQLLAAVERASETGVRQQIDPE
jgi:predicted dehydrogenase